MAYGHDRDGGDPRGPICPKCGNPILPGQSRTKIIQAGTGLNNPVTQLWHGDCAFDYFIEPQFRDIMRRLGRGWQG